MGSFRPFHIERTYDTVRLRLKPREIPCPDVWHLRAIHLIDDGHAVLSPTRLDT